MSQNSTLVSEEAKNDEFDLIEIIYLLWAEKWLIISFTFVFAVGSVIYALSLNNQYRAEALLQPVASSTNANNRLAQLASSFGGLASLAGINLSGAAGGKKTAMILEVLESRQFITDFIDRRNLTIPLWAGRLDEETGELVINQEIYDEATGTWLRDRENPEPTALESYRRFTDRLFVNHDKISNFITIGYRHRSPEVSAEWVSHLITDLNAFIKKQDQEDANLRIEYLKAELENTEIADLRMVINELIKEQLNTIMLTKVKTDYALKVIDPPVPPELAVGPKRMLIVVVATIIGGLLSLIYIFLRNTILRKVQERMAKAE